MTQVDELVWIEGGSFRMGSEDHYPEEAPVHTVAVDGFWIRPTQVTNRQFAEFVDATGYETVAERAPDPADYPGAPPENLVPGSLVFTGTPGPVDLSRFELWWTWTPGAQWRHPSGPGSDLAGLDDHPVVQVAHEDATAFAEWAGEALPTEAEWEYAARGGHEDRAFVWGDEPTPNGEFLANFFQGNFPWRNTKADGFERTSPVGSFPPNDYGLYDMAGNVWEWTDDWYVEQRLADRGDTDDRPCCVPHNPRGGTMEESNDPQFRIPRKVLKGGSFLCADEYCMRYRPAARRPQTIETGMSHLGFRTIRRGEPE